MICEYPIPLDVKPSSVAPVLWPWVEQFVGLDAHGVRQRLTEMWCNIQARILGPLVDHILSYTPNAFVVEEETVWLKMGEMGEYGFEGFFVSPQPTEDSVREALDRFGFGGTVRRLMHSFLLNFAGLREEPPPSAGFFAESPWTTLSDILPYPNLDFGPFHSAFPMFHCLGGDTLLVNPNGKTAWWLFAEGRLLEFLDDIEDCLEFYVRFRFSSDEDRDGAPLAFDPYSAFAVLGRPM